MTGTLEARDTLVLLAFVERRAVTSGARFSTDGETLRDSFGSLARWVDPTRIVVNEARDSAWSPMPAIEAFLAYWRHWKIIGVSRGKLEDVTKERAS